MKAGDALRKVRENIEARLDKKTSWGRNEIKAEVTAAIQSVLEEAANA